jgi:hypothetical protein
LIVSEQQAEQTSGEPGSLSAGPAVPPSSEAQNQPVTASAPEPVQEPVKETAKVESPALAPEQAAASDSPKQDAAKADAPKADAPKADALRTPGKLMIMSGGGHNWDSDRAAPEADSALAPGVFGKRRLAALAAVVALAALAGALGGALATASLSHSVADDTTGGASRALEAAVARIDADIVALKASVEHTSRLGTSQYNKTSDRLDKVEKAQAEPAAKLARLSEAVDKLRAVVPVAPVPVAAAPVAAKDVTGSISAPVTAAAAAAEAPKVEVARLPIVESWVLRDVANGGALIEGRRGMYEVYAGDPVPGLGRVDAIRKQDGRWVVVTSKGLIVAR